MILKDYTDKLLNDSISFFKDYSSFKRKEIYILFDFFRDYALAENKKAENKIISSIEYVINGEKTNNSNLFTVKNKHISKSFINKNNLINKHLWILRSILSRIKVYKRQKNFNNFNIKEINKNGVILINDFLNEDFYYSLLEEINNIPLALNKGDTNTIRYNNKLFSFLNYFPKRIKNSSHVLNKIVDNIYDLGYSDNYIQTISLVSKSSFWQKIKILKDTNDIQKDCHMDTFFPSLKFWYFPSSVKNNLAFRYAKSSNNLTYERMIIESKKINKYLIEETKYNSDFGNNSSFKSELEGSLRFNNSDLLRMNLDLDSFAVKQNTLLIADVSGLHSRSLGEVNEYNSIRTGIHGNIRHYKIF